MLRALLTLVDVGLEFSWTFPRTCPGASHLAACIYWGSIASSFSLHPQNSVPVVFKGKWEVRIQDTGASRCILHVFGRDVKAARAPRSLSQHHGFRMLEFWEKLGLWRDHTNGWQ